MIEHAVAATVASASAAIGAPASGQAVATIDDKTILDWCFIVGALDLATLGFLFNSYVTAKLDDDDPAPFIDFLRMFCRVLAGILLTLASLAAFIGFQMGARPAAWIIIISILLVSILAIFLVSIMSR